MTEEIKDRLSFLFMTLITKLVFATFAAQKSYCSIASPSAWDAPPIPGEMTSYKAKISLVNSWTKGWKMTPKEIPENWARFAKPSQE